MCDPIAGLVARDPRSCPTGSWIVWDEISDPVGQDLGSCATRPWIVWDTPDRVGQDLGSRATRSPTACNEISDLVRRDLGSCATRSRISYDEIWVERGTGEDILWAGWRRCEGPRSRSPSPPTLDGSHFQSTERPSRQAAGHVAVGRRWRDVACACSRIDSYSDAKVSSSRARTPEPASSVRRGPPRTTRLARVAMAGGPRAVRASGAVLPLPRARSRQGAATSG